MKILFISLNAKPGFELTDINFALFLKKKINFTFCVLSQKYYGPGGFYSYDNKIFKYNKDFLKLKTIWINYKAELKLNIINHDLIIFSPIHGSQEFVSFAKKHHKKVITLDSGFNYDFYPNNKSDLVILKGENAKKVYYRHGQRYSKKQKVLINPCLQSEFLKGKYLIKRKKFLRKYNIKKNKIAIFLPTGPQYHSINFKKKYKKIIKFLSDSKFHVILKLHPTEYNLNKITNNYKKNTKSSDLFKNIDNVSVCDQCDFYSAIKYSNFVFSTHTTAYIEVNLMQKPMIYIDRLDFFNLKNKNFYKERNKINIYSLVNKDIIDNKKVPHMDKEKSFMFYGCDIEFSYLKNNFFKKINRVSKKIFKKAQLNNYLYCAKYKDNLYSDLTNKIIKFKKVNHIAPISSKVALKIFYKIIIFIKKIEYLLNLVKNLSLLKLHGGKSMRNSLAVPATVKSERYPV